MSARLTRRHFAGQLDRIDGPSQPRRRLLPDDRLHQEIGTIGSRRGIEAHMTTGQAAIAWQHSLDEALEQARKQQKDVLLDFSAAPM